MRKIRTYMAAAMLAAATTAPAADLGRLCLRLASESAAVRAESARLDARTLEDEIANTLPGPDADFDYKFNAGKGDNRWGVSVGQSFDWPGVYSARREANAYRREAFDRLRHQNIVDKALELHIAAIRLSEARNNLGIVTTAAENLTELYNFVKKAFDRGEATVIALRKTELQLMSVRTMLAKAESELVTAEASIESILPGSLAEFDSVKDIETPPLQAEQDYVDAFLSSSGYIAREWELKGSRKDIDVARRSILPSFRLAYLHDYEDGQHFNGFSVGVALPSWTPSKNRRLAAAKALANELDTYDCKMLTTARIHADYVEAERLYSRISDYSGILAGDYPQLLKKAFDSGAMTIFNYLTEYNIFLEVFVEHNNLLAQYARLQARLAKNLPAAKNPAR